MSLEKDIVNNYTKGDSIREVVKKSGKSFGYVYKVLDRNGVERRNPKGYGQYKDVIERLTLEQIVEIIEDRKQFNSSLEDLTFRYNLMNIGVTRNILNLSDVYLKKYYKKDLSLDNIDYD